MKNTKRCFVLFSYYDRCGIEAYLEKQAEKGWMLDKITNFGWVFRRVEPKKIHFSVVYFAKAPVHDTAPTEELLTFYDFCEHAGWKLAAFAATMQIFFNEADEPTPIETDPVLEVAAIHASAKKQWLPSCFFLCAAPLLTFLLALALLIDPIATLSITHNGIITCVISCILMTIFEAVEIVRYYAWYRKAKEAAERDGIFIAAKGHKNLRFIFGCLMLLTLAFLVLSLINPRQAYIVVPIWIIISFTSMRINKIRLSAKRDRSIKTARPIARSIAMAIVALIGFIVILMICGHIGIGPISAGKNLAYTYEYNGHTYKVYRDELPLTVEDLTETDYDGYSYELRTLDNSVFMERKRAVQRCRLDTPAQPELDYTVITIKVPFLYELCRKSLIDEFADRRYADAENGLQSESIEIDATPWGAKQAYQLKLGDEKKLHFLLCYDNCFVEIDFDRYELLTPKQMETVAEKLGK